MAGKLIETHTNRVTGNVISTFVDEKAETYQEFFDRNGKAISDPRVVNGQGYLVDEGAAPTQEKA